MRCLALADALRLAGARTCFVSPGLPDYLRQMALAGGHEVALDEAALANGRWDWLVVDHYRLDARWEARQRASAARILAIDDLADRPHDCDALLDPTLHAAMQERYRGKVPERCRLFLGPTYALLREEFARLRAATPPRDRPANRIMVQMGGMDSDNQTAKALAAVERVARRLEVDVVVGLRHPARAAIEQACARPGHRLHVQTPRVAELMAGADLAIGAAGSTSWERCCLGLPAICMTQADNQVALAAGLAAGGAIVNLGDAGKVSVEDVAGALAALLDDPARLRGMSQRAAQLVDGAGAGRMRDHLLAA